MIPDPLDIAYMTKGAFMALADAPTPPNLDKFDGELGYVTMVIENASILSLMASNFDGQFTGVFAYDVSEPFGYEIGEAYLNGKLPAIRRIALRLLRGACQ